MRKLIGCLFVLLLLIALGESIKGACCIKYQSTRIPRQFLKSYRVQENTGHCNFRAIVFKTVNGNIFCGDPEKRWVKRGVEFLEIKKQLAASRKT